MDTVWMWIAWHLPRRLVYWCAIRVGTYEPRELTQCDFSRWEDITNRRILDGLRLWSHD